MAVALRLLVLILGSCRSERSIAYDNVDAGDQDVDAGDQGGPGLVGCRRPGPCASTFRATELSMQTVTYTYEDFKLIKADLYDSEWNLVMLTREYQYEDDRLKHLIVTGPFFEGSQIVTYNYDDIDSHLVSAVTVDHDGQIIRTTDYQFDSQGRRMGWDVRDGDGQLTDTCQVEYSGPVPTRLTFERRNVPTWTLVLDWDRFGTLMTTHGGRSSDEFDFQEEYHYGCWEHEPDACIQCAAEECYQRFFDTLF